MKILKSTYLSRALTYWDKNFDYITAWFVSVLIVSFAVGVLVWVWFFLGK